jgi:hypothetical protein
LTAILAKTLPKLAPSLEEFYIVDFHLSVFMIDYFIKYQVGDPVVGRSGVDQVLNWGWGSAGLHSELNMDSHYGDDENKEQKCA